MTSKRSWTQPPTWLGCFLLVAFLSPNAGAFEDESKPEQAKLAERSKAESEKELLEFVGEHQPQLLRLMTYLKQKQPTLYERAAKEMLRSQQRLRNLAERDAELYAVELASWKTRSQLQLLAAEISVSKDVKKADLESKLSELVELEFQQGVERLKLQRQRAEAQLALITSQLDQRASQHDELVEKSLKMWQARIAKQLPRSKKTTTKSKPSDSNDQ